MDDLQRKVKFNALRTRVAQNVVGALPDEYLKRVVSRAVFLGVDVFLVYGPQVKNRLLRAGDLLPGVEAALRARIEKLSRDYQGQYDKIRDSMTAHRHKLELTDLMSSWNSIDEAAVCVLGDEVVDMSRQLVTECDLGKHIEHLDRVSEEFLAKHVSSMPGPEGVRFSADALALARPNTVGLLPCHPDQEKLARLLSIVDMLEVVGSLARFSVSFPMVHELMWTLLLIDGLNVIDGLYDDAEGDPALLSRWSATAHGGVSVLSRAGLARDVGIEAKARDVRNHFAAHIDSAMSMDAIAAEVVSAPLPGFWTYVMEHVRKMHEAASCDTTTCFLCMRNARLEGLTATHGGFSKPFKA